MREPVNHHSGEQDEDFRQSARIILVETYFQLGERVALYALLGGGRRRLIFKKELNALNQSAATAALAQ